jgi:hypothetical protein
MKCKKIERLLLQSFDGLLKEKETEELENHIKGCSLCQEKRKQYQAILDSLKLKDWPEPKPYFWERLQPKLKEKQKYEAWWVWKTWSIRAIPVFLLLVLLLTAALVFVHPNGGVELSESGVLLLRNLNPLEETRTLFEEEKVENKNMMLIFYTVEEKNGTGSISYEKQL